MRSLALVCALSACGYPMPADRCEGPCAVYAVDRSFATESTELWLEGTFQNDMTVNFPGGAMQSLDITSDHRVAVTVPAEATTGDLTITVGKTTSAPIPFRRTTFGLTLQAFSVANEQNDYARTNWLTNVYQGATAVTIKNRVYLLGGSGQNGPTSDVAVATAGADGAIGTTTVVGQLHSRRAQHTSLVVGRYLYVFGGIGEASVERAMIDNDGKLGMFEGVPGAALTTPRSGHASAIIGNYVYVIGGSTGTAELASVERAQILDNDELGKFAVVAGKTLRTARTSFSIAISGDKLYVIGGLNKGSALDSIERVDLYGTAEIGAFEDAGKLITARANHVSIVVGTDVYVLGGSNGIGSLDTIERASIYMKNEPLMFTTDPAFKLSQPRQNAALTVVGNYVYLLGGVEQQTSRPVDTIERASIIEAGNLDPFAISSQMLQSPRHKHASVVLGNKLYVIGGIGRSQDILDTIEVSDINPDGTLAGFATSTHHLVEARHGHSLWVMSNTLYVIGGTGDAGHLATIESAPINEDGTLEPFTTHPVRLPTGRTDFVMFGLAMYGFVAGGTLTQPPGETDNLQCATLNAQRDIAMFQGYGTGTIVETRALASAVLLGKYVYVIGGASIDYRGIARASINYAQVANGFVSYANTPAQPRAAYVTAVVGNTLYLIGGANPVAQTSIVEKAKIVPDGDLLPWMGAPVALSNPRHNATTVTLGNYVYVIGGADNGSPFETIESSTIR